jgi:hypothetical protein
MRIFNRRFIFIVVALLAAQSASAQSGALNPIRVSLSSEEEQQSAEGIEFHALVRNELRKMRDVSFASKSPEFDIYLAVTQLKEKGRFIGYASATVVMVNIAGRQKVNLDIATGPTLEDLARHAVQKMREDVFDRRQRKER